MKNVRTQLVIFLFFIQSALLSCGSLGFPEIEGKRDRGLLDDDDFQGDDDDSVPEVDTEPPVIIHSEIPDGQVEGTPLTVTAEVFDESGILSVILYYSNISSGPFSQVTMINSGGDYFSGVIPGSDVQKDYIYYYLRAIDASTNFNESTSPDGAPSSLYDFLVTSSDTSPPTITHTPVDDGQEEGQSVDVSATITDSSGVNRARVYFRESGSSSFSMLEMSSIGSIYTATIPASYINPPSIDYYIWAVDSSSANNEATFPRGAPSSYLTFDVYQRYDLYYDDGRAENGYIGTYNGSFVTMRFTPQSYPAILKYVRVYLDQDAAPIGGTGRIRIWQDLSGANNGSNPSNLILSQDFTISAFHSYMDIDVSSANIELPRGDLYVGIGQYASYQDPGNPNDVDFYVGFDESSNSGRAWFVDTSGVWYRFSSFNIYGNLMIRIRYLAP